MYLGGLAECCRSQVSSLMFARRFCDLRLIMMDATMAASDSVKAVFSSRVDSISVGDALSKRSVISD